MANTPRNTSDLNRLSASPLPSGHIFFLADGSRCPYCATKLRCDPEPMADGASFTLDCPGCFRTIVRYE
jgi:hypothetical protein